MDEPTPQPSRTTTITTTRPGTLTITEHDEGTDFRVDEGDHDRFAHYVDKSKLTEAMVVGTPVIALCGKVWVPSRAPERFPICPECKRLFDLGPRGRRREWRERARRGDGDPLSE